METRGSKRWGKFNELKKRCMCQRDNILVKNYNGPQWKSLLSDMMYLFQFLDLMCRCLVTEAACLQKLCRCLKEQWTKQWNQLGIFLGKKVKWSKQHYINNLLFSFNLKWITKTLLLMSYPLKDELEASTVVPLATLDFIWGISSWFRILW